MSDHLHPLQRQRSILVEAVSQQSQLARLAREHDLDPRPYLTEGDRLAVRLLQVQEEIENQDIDN